MKTNGLFIYLVARYILYIYINIYICIYIFLLPSLSRIMYSGSSTGFKADGYGACPTFPIILMSVMISLLTSFFSEGEEVGQHSLSRSSQSSCLPCPSPFLSFPFSLHSTSFFFLWLSYSYHLFLSLLMYLIYL